uniref:Transposase n=1 Tax=Romanomermis culicivorax TaxID=13658 RepID=A0A915KGK8_ROMCU
MQAGTKPEIDMIHQDGNINSLERESILKPRSKWASLTSRCSTALGIHLCHMTRNPADYKTQTSLMRNSKKIPLHFTTQELTALRINIISIDNLRKRFDIHLPPLVRRSTRKLVRVLIVPELVHLICQFFTPKSPDQLTLTIH